ncbi:hypothetical protein BCR33DRAFT_520064 [Rhizoclosmatium globosum]|uniref:Fatty acid desaturase domain-containing protein n=1 Tax=Rhizoclosmatium globosum TaxID=329046 RepID=A0A1Y2BFK0_9FUNG|nr:hypothetical protein BCR33DRAFT_520064 [Rhizoclosmatium globosum]|eukprot:ORY33601.1 hypothetical protein BCR33DRAFT_520064 [Rhizoclosmatium globosum]
MARGNPIMMIICPLAGWFCGVNAFHDGCHFALSTNPFINSFVGGLFPFFSSPFAWYHQHIIGHHVHCNMEYHDPDLFHGVDIHREHKAHPFRAIYARQAKVLSIVFHFVVGSWLGLGLGSNINLIFSKSQTYNGVIPRIPVSTFTLTLHALSRLMFFIVQFGWPFFTLGPETGFFTKLAYAIVPSMVFSVCFMLNTQINHLTPSAMKEKSLDWTVHQVITAQNFGDPKKGGAAWWFHYLFSGGLNLQMEHHLFPTVNHCHLMVVSEIVERTCAEYGVRYTRVSGYLEGMTEYIKHTTMMSIDADAVETVSKPKPETEVGISKIIRETVKEVAKVDSVPVVVPVPQILKLKEE